MPYALHYLKEKISEFSFTLLPYYLEKSMLIYALKMFTRPKGNISNALHYLKGKLSYGLHYT